MPTIADEIVVLESGRVLLLLLAGRSSVHRRALYIILDMYLVLVGEHVPHYEQIVLLVLDGEAIHAEQMRQQRLALGLHDMLVVVLEHAVQALDVLAGDRLDYVALVVGDKELGAALATAAVEGLDVAGGQRLEIGLVVDVEALAHPLKHQRAVLFHFIVAGQRVLLEILIVDFHFYIGLEIVRHENLGHVDVL